jgi:hypothetical protein
MDMDTDVIQFRIDDDIADMKTIAETPHSPKCQTQINHTEPMKTFKPKPADDKSRLTPVITVLNNRHSSTD